ncbi:MAG: GspH/FimT family pseudopilin [Desulfobacterales bacterium]|nr:GspH/FimT family pseudopilin [Desulfobacterales bacterium]
MHNNSGVTLLEIVTVIGIMGIMSAIAIPNIISWLPDYRLKSAARELQSTMQFARFRAIKENTNAVVSFNIGTDEYFAFLDNGEGGGTASDETLNGNERIIRNATMPTEIDMYQASFGSSGGSNTVFNSMGLSDLNNSARDGSVCIKNNQNGYRRVTIQLAGHSRIQKSTDGVSWD